MSKAPDSKARPKKPAEEHATRKSGRWGAEEPSYGRAPPAPYEKVAKRPNPEGPE